MGREPHGRVHARQDRREGPVRSVRFSTLCSRVRWVTGSRRFRIAVGAFSSAFAAVLLVMVIRYFATSGWPLAGGILS